MLSIFWQSVNQVRTERQITVRCYTFKKGRGNEGIKRQTSSRLSLYKGQKQQPVQEEGKGTTDAVLTTGLWMGTEQKREVSSFATGGKKVHHFIVITSHFPRYL